MSDHERFLLLAAKEIGEPLTERERADLDAHRGKCPACRFAAAGMRRDDVALRAVLTGAPVAPDVRSRIVAEASGQRQIDARLLLALAAVLLLGVIAVPLMVGGPPAQTALATPSATVAGTPVPSFAESPSPSPAPGSPSPATASPSTASPMPPSPSPSLPARFVAGAYIYGDNPPRQDTVSAHFEDGPVGEWSRRSPATTDGDTFAGTVTCLVIDGAEAWLAGPMTAGTNGSTGAAMLYVHDGGPNGEGDEVVLWLATSAQTLTTMTGWCETRFIPAGPFPLTSGDVVVEDGQP